MFWSGAMLRTDPRRPHPPLKFATPNNFEHSTQFIGQKLPSAYLSTARWYSSCIWLTKRPPSIPPGTVTA